MVILDKDNKLDLDVLGMDPWINIAARLDFKEIKFLFLESSWFRKVAMGANCDVWKKLVLIRLNMEDPGEVKCDWKSLMQTSTLLDTSFVCQQLSEPEDYVRAKVNVCAFYLKSTSMNIQMNDCYRKIENCRTGIWIAQAFAINFYVGTTLFFTLRHQNYISTLGNAEVEYKQNKFRDIDATGKVVCDGTGEEITQSISDEGFIKQFYYPEKLGVIKSRIATFSDCEVAEPHFGDVTWCGTKELSVGYQTSTAGVTLNTLSYARSEKTDEVSVSVERDNQHDAMFIELRYHETYKC